MQQVTRRGFLRAAAAAAAGVALAPATVPALAPGNLPAEIPAGERPRRDDGVKVLDPRGRVPLSFIIDDSKGETSLEA